MIWQVAVAIAFMAFIGSILTIGYGLYAQTRRDIQQMIDVVGGLASALFWFTAAFGMSSLEVVESGVHSVVPADAVAILFAVLGVFMVVIALVGTAILLNVSDVAGMQQDNDLP